MTATPKGLTDEQADALLAQRGPVGDKAKQSPLPLLLRQFQNPILLLLVFSSILSGFLGDISDAITILAIVIAATGLSFYQEYQADASVSELLKLIQVLAKVRRSGKVAQVPIANIFPGDVVLLEMGSTIPGDGSVTVGRNLLVNESSMTGESEPVEKQEGAAMRAGTFVASGAGEMLVSKVGDDTEFGEIAARLRSARPEPEFHQGIKKYGFLLMEFTFLMTMFIFAANVYFHKPLVESFLFSLALAVGLTPQLLPAIMSITLAKGARELVKDKVVVKRLESIEDFGSMSVLCSDKTGTLTLGTVKVIGGFDPAGATSEEVLNLARLNAQFQKAYANPIDAALVLDEPEPKDIVLIKEIPYDFKRRMVSVFLQEGASRQLITKGAYQQVIERCASKPDACEQTFEKLSGQGYRVLAVATGATDDETGLVLHGFLALEDPLRPDSQQVVADLKAKGVALKLITGDNRLVAAHVARQIGLSDKVLTGPELSQASKALAIQAAGCEVFAEVDPVQKEHLIRAYRALGEVVGYIGDGINDGAALHASDVGISVAGAADVAREAADLVMLEAGLAVISRGVDEGRRIFANTLKYIYITTSANFGNMFSMAVASLFLPFLPLLPKQILLNNFLTDIPALTIAGDTVDADLIDKPRRWNVKALRTFMLVYGFQSSVFDMLSFAALYWWLRADADQFRTGWFIESALTELLILLVIRTKRPFFQSRPGKGLLWACIGMSIVVLLIPIVPVSKVLGFTYIGFGYFAILSGIIALYILSAELLKRKFLNL